MPLTVEVKRTGERMKFRWSWQLLSCIYTAAMIEAAPETIINDEFTYGTLSEGRYVDWSWSPIYYMTGCPLLEEGRQTLKQDHTFNVTWESGEEELIELKKGDEIRAWRSQKG